MACDGEIVAMAISEHVENAGTHSGDATLVLPAQDINNETRTNIESIATAVAKALNVSGTTPSHSTPPNPTHLQPTICITAMLLEFSVAPVVIKINDKTVVTT